MIDTYRTTKDVVLADLDAAAESAQSLMSLKESRGSLRQKDAEFEAVPPELHTFNKDEDEF